MKSILSFNVYQMNNAYVRRTWCTCLTVAESTITFFRLFYLEWVWAGKCLLTTSCLSFELMFRRCLQWIVKFLCQPPGLIYLRAGPMMPGIERVVFCDLYRFTLLCPLALRAVVRTGSDSGHAAPDQCRAQASRSDSIHLEHAHFVCRFATQGPK